MHQFLTAIRQYPKVPAFVSRHKLRGWLAIPGVVGLAFYLLIVAAAWIYASDLAALFAETIDPLITSDSLQSIVDTVLVWVFRVFLLVIVFVLYKILLINVMSPMLLLIGHRVHSKIFDEEKEEKPFRLGKFLSDIAASLVDALRILAKELGLIAVIALLSLFIPFLSPFFALLVLLVESYFVGISMLDIIAGYREMDISKNRHFRRKYRIFALGNGLVFSLLFLIPLLGVLIAPSMAMVSAGLGIRRLEKQNG